MMRGGIAVSKVLSGTRRIATAPREETEGALTESAGAVQVAIRQLRSGSKASHADASQLFHLLVLPSFDPAVAWELYRVSEGEGDRAFFAVCTVWRSDLDRVERIEIPPDEKTIHFSFPQPKPSGRVVAEFKRVAKSYGAKLVFSNVDFNIERGDRVALVGVNGAGKSTLIKLLAGAEQPTAGEYRLGHNAEPDYFAQDQYKELDPTARILEDISSVVESIVLKFA